MIDLKKIAFEFCKTKRMSNKEFAAYLFPNVKNPVHCMYHVIIGELPEEQRPRNKNGSLKGRELHTSEIWRLCRLFNCTFEQLMNEGYKDTYSDSEGSVSYRKGDWTVRIDTVKMVSTIYKKGELKDYKFHHQSSVPASEIIKYLNTYIENEDSHSL